MQNTLFSPTKKEALEEADTSESIAKMWFINGYLSYDISKLNELQYPQLLELTFISALFKSTLDLDTLNNLLLQLQKPYAYNYHKLYYNVFTNEWEKLPEVEEVDEEEFVNNYLENLNAKDNSEEIQTIIDNLQILLK